MSTPLAMDPEEFRRLGYQTVDLLVDYLGGLSERAVFTPMTPPEREAILGEALPDAGLDAAALLERCRT
ncbi:MAG: amino acid decarboxylase, partial [Candidatus Rokuibacteriota bacterium]